MLAALLGFLIDGAASLWLARPRAFARGATALLLLGAARRIRSAGHAARTAETQGAISDQEAALETHLGYVVSGDADVDETSRLGLARLGQALAQRTSAALADPVGLDPARDELAFYPLIYWPIVAGRPAAARPRRSRASPPI